MTKVFEDLKNHSIINPQNIIDLKSHIKTKYPDNSANHTAMILANAIHRIIDQNIFCFDPHVRNDIKHHLIKDSIEKNSFSITAYEVFKVCSSLNTSDADYLDHLTTWLNHNQSIPLSKEEVLNLISSISDTEAQASIPASSEENWLSDTIVHLKTELLKIKRVKTTLISFVLNAAIIFTLSLCFYIMWLFVKPYIPSSQNTTNCTLVIHSAPVEFTSQKPKIEHNLPSQLCYKRVNKEALKNWLHQKNSILSEEPYFSSIIKAARDYNINPLLLFAITGQEQGYVPKHHTQARLIANNPFNVYESWKKYNTHIDDTSAIVARTIINLSKDCPEGEDTIKWINRKYADDPDWYKGVSQILSQLEEAVGN